MTDEELNKKKEEIIKHDRDSITNRIRHSFNCGFDMGREYAKEHQKVVYKTKYVYADGVEIEPTEDGRYTGCSNCKYVDKGLHVCQAMLCKHSIDKLYERFEPKEWDMSEVAITKTKTVVQCKKCGLFFKPSLGHKCRK